MAGPETDSAWNCSGTGLPYQVVGNAIASASRDPRFAPVTPDELPYIGYSVDVLGPVEGAESADDLDPSVYGLVIQSGARRGLLLPNLPGVQTVEQQIRLTAQKAGIVVTEVSELYRFKVEQLT
ncbi:MAG: AMMECR1 domain-containing protein [Dehalococcoidia bacterium]